MNLLSKIQNKLKGGPAEAVPGQTPGIEELNKLPDSEKLKVLDYLSSVKELNNNFNE